MTDRQPVVSRIARDLVNRYGRLPAEKGVRHGSEEVAKSCRCEVCRRAYPDNAKRHKLKTKALRTRSCMGGAVGHGHCAGWRFAAGNSASAERPRDASPCACPCHSDGRGKPIPTLDEWLATRAAEAERSRQWHANRMNIEEPTDAE